MSTGGGEMLETFIIRVYRSENILIGVVEDLFGNGRKTYKNAEELKEIFDYYKDGNLKLEQGEEGSIAIQRIMEEKLETYVVNIYRFGKGNPDTLAGMIRKSTSKERQAFSSFEELWGQLKEI